MGVNNSIYLKADRHSLVTDPKVRLSDVMRVEGADHSLVGQIKSITLYRFAENLHSSSARSKSESMVVFSILKVIQLIHERFPEVWVVNMGASDFIVELSRPQSNAKWLERLKLFGICVVTFFGAAFTIMAFNNDISVRGVFEQFYLQVMGQEKPYVSVLEICYSIGIAIGILIFFNHIGHMKITPDPTPIQVELRKYESDVSSAFIENASRKGHNEDVD